MSAGDIREQQKIRVLVVSDDPAERELIRSFVQQDPDLKIVAESAGRNAVKAIVHRHPDLLFLPVEMENMSGLDVVRSAGLKNMPQIIFLSENPKYALQAFEANALDFLLKPLDSQRLQQALKRAKRQIRLRRAGHLADLLVRDALRQPRRSPSRIIVKGTGRIVFVALDDVDWIEANDNYVKLQVGRHSYSARVTMNELEAKLDPARFVRIHRGGIINLNRLREIRTRPSGEYTIVMQDGHELTLGRSYRDKVMKHFETRGTGDLAY